jgi:hypothetical protein
MTIAGFWQLRGGSPPPANALHQRDLLPKQSAAGGRAHTVRDELAAVRI